MATRHIGARSKLDAAALDAEKIVRTVRPLFHRRNDYGRHTLDELPGELRRFGVVTVKALRMLMKRHRRTLLADEKVRMGRAELRWLSQELGGEGVDTYAGTSWRAIPGLVRQAMELEFGCDA
ncbi:hypothetical protein [Luteimonas sp. FCS-9]|uniref:hypothetical protein n=1 Tax=Luteimonas sp. FCS-9 TaxID=1547516 RepID=UPI00063E750C|nr:hypothetical protein [Luteimonas sp. FCS-9]KLI98989.1 hypothetical protein WQ56_13535 [Luteimonas sp. FCS-9]